MKCLVVIAVVSLIAAVRVESAPRFTSPFDFSFTTSHGSPPKVEPPLVEDKSTIDSTTDAIPSLTALDDTHSLSTPTTEAPQQLISAPSDISLPHETHTFLAYRDFLNTWLHLASINLNRPDLLNHIIPLNNIDQVLNEQVLTNKQMSQEKTLTEQSIASTNNVGGENTVLKLDNTSQNNVNTQMLSSSEEPTSTTTTTTTTATTSTTPTPTTYIPSTTSDAATTTASTTTTATSTVVSTPSKPMLEAPNANTEGVHLDVESSLTQFNDDAAIEEVTEMQFINDSLSETAPFLPLIDEAPQFELLMEEILKPVPIVEKKEITSLRKTAKSLSSTAPIQESIPAEKTFSHRFKFPAFRYTVAHSPRSGSFFFNSAM